jgi:uncharacterized OB-fold protein
MQLAKTKEIPFVTSRRLTYAHKIPILKTQLFWEKLKEGEIYATKCKKCGRVYYPPQADCPECLTSEIEWFKLSDEATLETYTQVQARPQGFEQHEPYIIAIATTADGVKIAGRLENVKLEDVKVGMKLKTGTRILEDGYVTITFKKLER